MGITKSKSNVSVMVKSRKNKDDEFYTPYGMCEKMLNEYTEDLTNKIIYCNCDLEWSNFVIFLKENKHIFKYKELYWTGLTSEFVFGDYNVGDFRNSQSIELLKKCDVVITNPPFSLIAEWYELVKKYNKKFLLLAPVTFIARKSVRQDFLNKKIFLNQKTRRLTNNKFLRPDKSIKDMPIFIYTNIKKIKYNYKDTTHKVFIKDCNYKFYDGTDILAITNAERIPIDYNGLFTMSISQIWHFDFEKYDLLCFTTDYKPKLLIDGKEQFVRLLCQKKQTSPQSACLLLSKELTLEKIDNVLV